METRKIQITLTPQETAALMLKARALGYNVVKFVKFLVSREAYGIVERIPQEEMSARLEEKVVSAISDYQKGKTLALKSAAEIDKL